MWNRLVITTALALWLPASAPGLPRLPVPARIPPLDSLAANIVRIGFIPDAGELPVVAAASGWFGMIADIRVVDPGSRELSRILTDSTGAWAYCGLTDWPGRDGILVVLAPPPYCLPDGVTASVGTGDQVSFSLSGYTALSSPATAVRTPDMNIVDLLPDTSGVFSFQAARRGIYWVEVLSEGPNGPSVSLLFPVISGGEAMDVLEGTIPLDAPSVSSAPQILEDMNALRLRAGLDPLDRSAQLDSIAAARAAHLALTGTYDHLSSGLGLEQMLPAGVGPFGENIARGSGFQEAWSMVLLSPFHLRTCLSPDYSFTGIGAAVDWGEGQWQLVMVQVFTGEPLSP
jgi:hypothetical protein